MSGSIWFQFFCSIITQRLYRTICSCSRVCWSTWCRRDGRRWPLWCSGSWGRGVCHSTWRVGWRPSRSTPAVFPISWTWITTTWGVACRVITGALPRSTSLTISWRWTLATWWTCKETKTIRLDLLHLYSNKIYLLCLCSMVHCTVIMMCKFTHFLSVENTLCKLLSTPPPKKK